TLNRCAIDLAAVTTRAVDALATAARTARHHVAVEAQPVWVDGDPTRLEQVAANLVGNALKYTPPGGTIRVTVLAEPGRAVLRVADTGIGISPELLPHVFDLF